MGRDKALLPIDGGALVARVADTCRRAGCAGVWAIGGDRDAIQRLGIDVIADRYPGEGPLGAIITALGASTDAESVFIASVDLPGIRADDIRRTVESLAADPHADLAVPVTPDGRRHHLHASWRPRCRAQLEAAFRHGERAPWRVLEELTVREVPMPEPHGLTDVDTPADLRRWQQDHGSPRPDR